MTRSVPLIFNDPAYHAPIDGERLCVTYRVDPCEGSQKRFKGRLYAEPQVDLQEYEFRAVFDWIEVHVETARVFSAVNLQRRLTALNKGFKAFRTCHVTSPTRERWYSGRGHVIKMQDPAPDGLPGLLRAFLREDCVPGYEREEIPVTGVELSLDVYPAPRFCRDEADYAVRRMLMTDLMRKHVAVDEVYRAGQRRPRFVFQDGTRKTTQHLVAPGGSHIHALRKISRETGAKYRDVASCDPESHHQPCIDATFYFGQKGERLLYRQMDKITDNRAGDVADDLPYPKTRSRLEFTFMDQTPGDGLGPRSVGIQNITDLALDGLTSFNTMLIFELPTFDRDKRDPGVPDQQAWEIFAKTGVAGLSQRDDAFDLLVGDRDALRQKSRREVVSSGRNLRYSTMNSRVTKALRRLQERWRRDWL